MPLSPTREETQWEKFPGLFEAVKKVLHIPEGFTVTSEFTKQRDLFKYYSEPEKVETVTVIITLKIPSNLIEVK